MNEVWTNCGVIAQRDSGNAVAYQGDRGIENSWVVRATFGCEDATEYQQDMNSRQKDCHEEEH